MLQLGQEPEGLTEAMRATLGEFRDRLESGDILRMLRLLTDSETSIRRSVSPRLVVETLLLRWAMMDRIVDLAQVLASHPGGGAPAAPRGGGSTATPPSARPTSSVAPDPGPPDVAPIPPPVPEGSAELEQLRQSWEAVITEVRARSRFLGEALGNATPIALDPPWLTLSLDEPHRLFAEPLQAQARVIEDVLQRVSGRPLRLRVAPAGAGDASLRPARPPSEASIKADRLRGFRAKDPALDTAADALDLEIVD
jgi:DNA polymerase-3 subunit gamma/tau